MKKKLVSQCSRCIFLFLSLAVGCFQHPHKKLTELENQYLESFFRHLLETTTAGYSNLTLNFHDKEV
ncbi:MAG TPA: hypothetical protein VGZ69_05985 [Candidatus Rhabdochlamydia sp.]|jgi:hypothetical protein|nr:hypothetical protein [Candidatus Rhabdochlamydia sp.]